MVDEVIKNDDKEKIKNKKNATTIETMKERIRLKIAISNYKFEMENKKKKSKNKFLVTLVFVGFLIGLFFGSAFI